MIEKMSARELLRAFEHIRRNGEQRGDAYFLNTLRGDIGHDGYTVTISDETVSATVNFHNTIHVDAPGRKALGQFQERISSLNASYRRQGLNGVGTE